MQANKIVAIIGLALDLSIGSWWMAQAMVAGNTTALLVRAVAVTVAGVYYLALYRSRLFQPHRYH